MFFFFKLKTAYEMRISDWSSDVCSSDLLEFRNPLAPALLDINVFQRVAKLLEALIPLRTKRRHPLPTPQPAADKACRGRQQHENHGEYDVQRNSPGSERKENLSACPQRIKPHEPINREGTRIRRGRRPSGPALPCVSGRHRETRSEEHTSEL